MSVQTIYNRRNKGLDLPEAIKIGTSLRYKASNVQDWVERHREPGRITPVIESAQRERPVRRRGRPTKAESIAARKRAAGVVQH